MDWSKAERWTGKSLGFLVLNHKDPMDWKKFFKLYLRNMIITIALAVIALGVLGYILTGKEGLANGATIGFILGMVSISFSGMMMLPKYWGDYAAR